MRPRTNPDVGIQSVDEKFRTISRATHHAFPFHREPRFFRQSTVIETSKRIVAAPLFFFPLPTNWIRSRDFQERWISKEFAGCVNRWLRVCAIVLKKIETWASQGVALNVKRASSRARRGDRSGVNRAISILPKLLNSKTLFYSIIEFAKKVLSKIIPPFYYYLLGIIIEHYIRVCIALISFVLQISMKLHLISFLSWLDV